MKKYILFSFFLLSYLFVNAQSLQDTNKEIARNFYQDLWFSNNTDRYQQYLADEYIINDIGDEKGLIEKSIEQKEVADFFWANGDMSGEIDYQLADGDIVATRWIWRYTPSTFFGSVFFAEFPGWQTWLGGAIIIAACLIVAFESRFITRKETGQPVSDLPE